jgi:putative flippase GtrA
VKEPEGSTLAVSNPVVRWLKFNGVGALGFLVQLACLAALQKGLHLHYLLATGLAVETAVLHNFVWHERFTWKDRAGGPLRERLMRLARFHLGNGLVSIAGNLVLMRLLVGVLHFRILFANIIAIAVCSLLNFVVSEWFVFRPPSRVR